MNWTTRWRMAAWATTLVAVVSVYEAAVVATHHLESPDWTPHARFHALTGGLHLAALALAALLLAWGPLRAGARPVRVALVFVLSAISAGPLVAWALLPEGAPPVLDRGLAAGGLVIVAAIAFLVRRPEP